MNKKLIASLVGIATLGTAFLANAAIEENQLTVWVNGDKGYNGIAKVGLLRQCHAKFHFCGAWFLPVELGHDPIREQSSPQLKGERPKSDRVRLFFNN